MQPINILDDVLSPEQCQGLIRQLEAHGYRDMGRSYPPAYRDNDRAILDSAALARDMLPKVRAALPASVRDGDGRTWTLAGLNPRFRTCRYRGGQSFILHRDGAWSPRPGMRSFKTVMLYLNGQASFTGGGTRFYPDRRGRPQDATRVTPHTGQAIVFGHDHWHDGEAVSAGTKYVLRTDAMYVLADPDARDRAARHLGYIWDLSVLGHDTLLTASRDGTVGVWRAGSHARLLDRHPCASGAASSITTCGQHWVTGDRRGRLSWWRDATPVRKHAAHDGAILRLLTTRHGVVSSGADGCVHLWSPAGERLHTWSSDAPHWSWATGVTPAGEVCSVLPGGRVCLLTPGETELIAALPPGTRATALAARGPGDLVVGTHAGRVLRIRERVVTCIGQHEGQVRSLDLDAHGAVVSGGEDDTVRTWDASGWHARHDDFVTTVRWLPDGRIASASYDGTVRLHTPADAPHR